MTIDSKNEFQRIPLDDPSKYFYTYDIGLCAALISNGYKLVTLDKNSSGRVLFVILRSSDIGEAIEGYWADRLQTRARAYFDTLKMLKNRLYSL